MGRLTYRNHQPPKPSPPPSDAHFASCPASAPRAVGCRIVHAITTTAIKTQGESPVAQTSDAGDDADERPPLRGRDHPRSQEVGNEGRAHPVGHGLAQDERGNGQQEADVHAEVHGQGLVDASRQYPSHVDSPGDEGAAR
jgi:hypothetical protein